MDSLTGLWPDMMLKACFKVFEKKILSANLCGLLIIVTTKCICINRFSFDKCTPGERLMIQPNYNTTVLDSIWWCWPLPAHNHCDIFTYNLSVPKRFTLDVPNQSSPTCGIENNNPNIHSDPSIKWDRGNPLQLLQYFYIFFKTHLKLNCNLNSTVQQSHIIKG